MSISLYHLNEKVRELITELDSIETETASLEITGLKPEEVIADLESTLSELFTAIDEKRQNYIFVIRSATADAQALRAEAKHLSTRAKRLENLAAHLKGCLHQDMLANGEVRADAGIFKLRIATSPARVVLEVPAELLPKAYQKVSISANANALKQALKDGKQIDGAVLEQGTHLRIS